MTRPKPFTTLLLSSITLLAFIGCHTTVVQPVQQEPVAQPQPDHSHDHDHDRDHQPPPPPPPDHHDDGDHHDQQPQR